MTASASLCGNWCVRLSLADPEDPVEVVTLTIAGSPGAYTVHLDEAPAEHVRVEHASDPAVMEFGCLRDGQWEWYRLRLVEQVLTGRFSRQPSAEKRDADSGAYEHFVTGWNVTEFERELTPRVYDVAEEAPDGPAAARPRATLRLDRDDASGRVLGRFKRYAAHLPGQIGVQCAEGLEYEVEIIEWDGVRLCFKHPGGDGAGPRLYRGELHLGVLRGKVEAAGPAPWAHWRAVRGAVLTFGFTPKPASVLAAWQTRTRRMLKLLMMSGDPACTALEAVTLQAGVAPKPLPVPRDDDPERHAQAYQLSELELRFTFLDELGREVERRCRAWLAVPTAPPAAGKYPAAICLNGHLGSAHSLFFPGQDGGKQWYWYGDAFARRGYVVLAVNISHRPPPDRRGRYTGYENGDDPAHGNPAQPAIRHASEPRSAWEEPGERAWDVMRAHDYLCSLPFVASDQVVVVGLSMGGEVAGLVGALDPRVRVTLPAGCSADLAVMQWHGNHACWQWLTGDMREYVDVSDLHALIAPRALVLQTSMADDTFSSLPTPFAADKQAARRVRAAYTDAPGAFIHYLHHQRLYRHEFCVGDINPDRPEQAPGVTVPLVVEPGPGQTGDTVWQTDSTVAAPPLGENPCPTLFDYLNEFLKPPEAAHP